jgi:hypothetical protein
MGSDRALEREQPQRGLLLSQSRVEALASCRLPDDRDLTFDWAGYEGRPRCERESGPELRELFGKSSSLVVPSLSGGRT